MSPRVSSQQFFLCLLLTLCFLSSACSSKHVITRREVNALLSEIEQAAQNRNVEAILSRISPNAKFKVTIEGFGPTQILQLNRDQYRDYARQGFDSIETYDYRRGETVINVDEDGQTAYVADETFETVTMKGKVISTVTRGTSVLKMEDGRLVIVSSESVGRPMPDPAAAKLTSLK